MKAGTQNCEKVLVIGAGMSGMAAAIRLAKAGHQVTILEGREQPGGLASGFSINEFHFDSGPYILLDRPGLEWAFEQLGVDFEPGIDQAKDWEWKRVKAIYEVNTADGERVEFHSDIDKTAEGFEAKWKGSGEQYRRFVAKMFRHYKRLQFMNYTPEPGLRALLRGGGWREVPLLLRSMGQVLDRSGLPEAVKTGTGIWTHVAGYSVYEAPSPMTFVPGIFHNVGAWYPTGGIAMLAGALYNGTVMRRPQIRFGAKVKRILVEGGRAIGVEMEDGEQLPGTCVVSTVGGPGTYLDLAEKSPAAAKAEMKALPLQSPGFCIYLAVKGRRPPHYLRFQLSQKVPTCVALIQPGLLDPGLEKEGWYPARLLGPLSHEMAEKLGAEGQQKLMDKVLEADWWKEGLEGVRVLERRTSADWGRKFSLHRDSMNPVMTAKLMRKGRVPHRSAHIENLYLAGSSTHPGQWVSFAAISGILAADALLEDKGRNSEALLIL